MIRYQSCPVIALSGDPSSSSLPEHAGPTDSEQPPEANRGVMNTKIFASCYESCLLETIATYSEDFMDSPVDATQQRNILKTLSKKFQNAIKSIHEELGIISEMVQTARHLKEAAN